MINELNLGLKQLFAGEAAPGSELSQATISFAAPTKDWRSKSTGLGLNVYLFRLQEDRARRINERIVTRNADGTTSVGPTPTRLECAYVISAWNFAQQTNAQDPELQEHKLLSQALLVLWQNTTLPAKYLSDALAASQKFELPVIAAESNELGAGDSDFWSGLDTYLRPTVTCKVTMSLDLQQVVTETMVTTAVVNLGNKLFLIGGTVATGSPPIAVPNAWVRVDGAERLYVTDASGRFVIPRISAGTHTLLVRAIGFQDGSRAIQVPQPDGEYDVLLTPL